MSYKYFGTKKKFRNRESIINADSRYYRSYQIHKINDVERAIDKQIRFQKRIGNESFTKTQLLVIMVGVVCVIGNWNELNNFIYNFMQP